MTEKFRNKYRIPSNRLRGWDYASSGHYYISDYILRNPIDWKEDTLLLNEQDARFQR